MKHPVRFLLILLALLAGGAAHAASLAVDLKGLDGELRRNALAWLGAPPDSPQERLNFLVSARDKVRDSLQALGYYRADVDLTVQRTDPVWQLTIEVDPGAPVRVRNLSVQLLGQAAADEAFADLLTQPDITSGEVLHHGRYEHLKKRLLALGQQRGYLQGELVTSRVEVEAGGGTADIHLAYQSGPRYRFGRLVFADHQIDEALLKSLRTFREGDYFEQSALQSYQAQLQRTGYFSSVIVQPQPAQAETGRVPVAVQLHPAERHSFDVGVGYSTDTEERVTLTWRTPRINRFGHSQITRLEYSPINPSGRLTYNIPLTHPLDDVLQLWARAEDDEFGDVDSRQQELGMRRDIHRDKWLFGYALRALNESWDVAGESAENDYLLLGGTLSRRDRMGSVVDPRGGFSQVYTLEAGSEQAGSDVDLVRLTADWRSILTPLPRHRIVARVSAGIAETPTGGGDQLAPSLKFFAGGSQSIRGFSYNSVGDEVRVKQPDGSTRTLVVGGDRLLTGSLEYQYYVTDKWRGAVFFDAGDAFNEGDFNLNYAPGFGVHYLTPVGAIRFELANSLSERNPSWQWHLTIGAEF
ncbi:MAG: outer membrane protein assembly factor [Halioglobus sp.]|nr:outer membrane protein assembly factor [Halioglobus sp.]